MQSKFSLLWNTYWVEALLVVLVIVATAASGLYLNSIEPHTLSVDQHYPVGGLGGDSPGYVQLAENMLSQGFFSDWDKPGFPGWYWPAGYPMTLAASKAVSGGFMLVVILQTFLAACAVVCVYRMAQEFLSKKMALVPAILFAIDPIFVFYNSTIMTDGIFTSLLVCVIYGLFFSPHARRLRQVFIAGMLLGVSVLFREVGEYLVIILPIVYAIHFHLPWKKSLQAGILFIIGASIVLLPFMIRNEIVHGEFNISDTGTYNSLYEYVRPWLTMQVLRQHEYVPTLMLIGPESDVTSDWDATKGAIGTALTAQVVAMTKPGEDPQKNEMPLALHYIAQDPFGYAYFHLVNTIPFFMYGYGYGYGISAQGSWEKAGIPPPPTHHMEIIKNILSSSTSIFSKLSMGFPLFLVGLDTAIPLLLLVLSVIALWLAPASVRRQLLIFAILILYFALLTGPMAVSVRVRLPVDPYLFILATIGVVYIYTRLKTKCL